MIYHIIKERVESIKAETVILTGIVKSKEDADRNRAGILASLQQIEQDARRIRREVSEPGVYSWK